MENNRIPFDVLLSDFTRLEGVAKFGKSGGSVHLLDELPGVDQIAFKFDAADVKDQANFILCVLHRVSPLVSGVETSDGRVFWQEEVKNEPTPIVTINDGCNFDASHGVSIIFHGKDGNDEVYSTVDELHDLTLSVSYIPDYSKYTKNRMIREILSKNNVSVEVMENTPIVQALHTRVLRGSTLEIPHQAKNTYWTIGKIRPSARKITEKEYNHALKKKRTNAIYLKV